MNRSLTTTAALLLILPFCFVSGLLQTASAQQTEFHVSPDGNDDWSGRLANPNADGTDGPFATIHRARDAVRQFRDENPNMNQPVVVAIHGGTYRLENPLTLTPEDSGTESSPTIYEGRDGTVRLSGGRTITNWSTTGDGTWETTVSAVPDEDWHFTQLFVDGERRYRPRLPEEGYFHVEKRLEPTSDAPGNGDNRFQFQEGDIRSDWSQLQDVEVLLFNRWTFSRLPIASVNQKQRIVKLSGTGPSDSWWGQFQEGNRYLVTNVPGATDEPGEWYLNNDTGKLTYVPRTGEDPENTPVVAPRLRRLLTVRGKPESNQFVEHVQFKNLDFAHTHWSTPEHGRAEPQAEADLYAAISVLGGRNLTFDQCDVKHVGTYAFAFGNGSRKNTVKNGQMRDLGAGGVKIGVIGVDNFGATHKHKGSKKPPVASITVRNNLIARGGRMHAEAVGVWIGDSPHNTIEHNEIYDFYYTTVSVGWQWGYDHSMAHHNRIAYNHMHKIGQGVLSDMGGVYTLGVSPGTEVVYNLMHNIRSYDYGGWGLYTDEGSTNIRMANNVVHHTKTGGFHQHYGKNNVIENNYLAYATENQLERTKVEDHNSFTFRRNVVLYRKDGNQPFSNKWPGKNITSDNNLYWNENGSVRFPDGRTLEQWQNETGNDQNSLVAPPKEAPKLGIKQLDRSEMGRVGVSETAEDLPEAPPAFPPTGE